MDKIEILIVALIIGIFGLIGVGVAGSVMQIAVVEVEGREVFRGMAMCVDVKSAGAATQVDIGIPCKFPGQHFTNKDVKVTVK